MSLNRKVRGTLYLKVLWLLLVIFCDFTSSRGVCVTDHSVRIQPGGVCSSMDIRNDIKNLRKLENCTVIEGYLHISLIESVNQVSVKHEDYEPYKFPLLREITDHLVLYRVYGLRTLRDMFPNLAIIRGRVPFTNYALVAYEMIDLEELGLVNLQIISRGGVRLAKNKKLCYVDTVDWARLGVEPEEQDFKYNREESQCANYCPERCSSTQVDGVTAKRCWTSQHCQKNLNCKGCKVNQTCMDNGQCCHSYCLGGCTGPSREECFSCRNVEYNGMCQLQCPHSTYMFFQRRCLTDKECSQLNLKNSRDNSTRENRLVLYHGENKEPSQCLSTCPANYMVEVRQDNGGFEFSECVPCKGPCPKECQGSHINSIQVVQTYTDCSKIVGNLTIEILGGSNVAEEMEKGLGQIKEITGKLHIHKSFPLLNLFFFKSLEVIGGEHNSKSFQVNDNKNLQELFPEEQMKKMVLSKLAEFDGNPKLCPSKIIQFKTYLNLSDNMIKIGTNGDLMPCADKHLKLSINKIKHDHAVVEFEQVSEGDSRRVLSYIINYKEIKDKYVDVNIYQGRDACSEDVWMTLEKTRDDDTTKNLLAKINDLKPYTTYAVYVQAYTLSTASHSAMTQVETFTTNPFNPSKPRDVEVIAIGPHELRVKWTIPKEPNGIIDHYVVSFEKEELNGKEFDKRDYCKQPVVTSKKKEKEEVDEKEKYQNTSSNCCACPKSKSELEAEAKKQEMDIYFEDFLHGSLYCKRFQELPFELDKDLASISLEKLSAAKILPYDHEQYGASGKNLSTNDKRGQKKYTIAADYPDENSANVTSNSELKNRTGLRNETLGGPREVKVNGTELILTNLEHFREYSIMVKACHMRKPKVELLCSTRAITQGRTKALATFDSINMSTIEVSHVTNTSGDVVIKWGMPAKPNGLTVKFLLKYKQANQENLVAKEVCVSMQTYYKRSGYLLQGLAPGNWTFQIRPFSLGGNGMETKERYFAIDLPPRNDGLQTEIVVAIVCVALVIIVILIISYCCVKHRFRKEDMTVISQNINYIPSEPAYIMDGWEVDRNKIRTIREIGQGSFGMVYEGIATGLGDDPNEEIKVAVKTVNDRAGFNDRREFLKEATTMKAFDCFHVVKLLGVVSTGQPALVIMELMALGDLKNYLREHRPDEDRPDVTPPSLQDILQMAGEVADGMAYLADKKFVHRDLAARNCMVAEDKTVKIGDFGMTRDVYETDYYRKGGKGMLPVRWMAPESLKDGMFSSMSDVWSYGVVIWEMVTLAAQPYQGLSNDQVIKFITDGSTMEMPERCPEEMAYLMNRCWAKRIKNRPTFKDIIAYLMPHLNSRFEKLSYYFSEGGGHASDSGRGLGEPEEDNGVDEEDGCSINSLSCEGAAAPRQSLRNASDYGDGSATGSADSVSVYDEGIDSVTYMDDNEQSRRGRYISHPGELYQANGELYQGNGYGDLGIESNDIEQPFIRNNFQDVPRVMIRQPNGPASTPLHSGLIELQPLLGAGKTETHPSSRPNTVQTSSHPPFTPEVIDHPHYNPYRHQQCSPSAPTLSPGPLDTQQSSQNCNPFSLAAADPLRSGPPGQYPVQPLDPLRPETSNPLRLGPCDPLRSGPPGSYHPEGPSSGVSPPAKSSPLPTTSLAKPSLRLPTLNQPPSGGFKRVPLFNASGKLENKDNGSSIAVGSRDSHLPVKDSSGHQLSFPASSNLFAPEDSQHSETSPILSDPLHTSSHCAIASSSEGSKDSGSHSRVNGLSNGHIPMSASSSNRTTPC